MSAVPHLHVRDDERQPVPGDLPVRPPRQHRELSGPAGRISTARASAVAAAAHPSHALFHRRYSLHPLLLLLLLLLGAADARVGARHICRWLVRFEDGGDPDGAAGLAAGVPAVGGDEVHEVIG